MRVQAKPRTQDKYRLTLFQTHFSPAASSSTSTGGQEKKEPTASLQISGKVVQENDYVRMGAFHTLDLEGQLIPYVSRQS